MTKKILEDIDALGIPLEEDMANAIQKYTGLPGVVYFCTRDEMKNPQAHAIGRIKWIHAGHETMISIKTNSKGNRIAYGDQRAIAKLEKLIKKNEDLFWAYWNTPAGKADSAAMLSKIKPV